MTALAWRPFVATPYTACSGCGQHRGRSFPRSGWQWARVETARDRAGSFRSRVIRLCAACFADEASRTGAVARALRVLERHSAFAEERVVPPQPVKARELPPQACDKCGGRTFTVSRDQWLELFVCRLCGEAVPVNLAAVVA